MYCQNCGTALSEDARFCQKCGRAQLPPQPMPFPPPVQTAAPPRIVQAQKPKSKALWLVIGGIVLLVIIIGILGKSPSDNSGSGNQEKAQESAEQSAKEAQFNALKPSEHLAQAALALKQGSTPDQIEEGIHHLNAIPQSAPDAAQANSLMPKLVRAQHLAEAKFLIESASVGDLKANLDNLRRANDEIQAVLQQNPHDKDALKLLTLATNKGREALGGSEQQERHSPKICSNA